RRHTRSTRDWSSDVCSSDLATNLRDASKGSPEDPARLGGLSQQGATTQEQWPVPDELDRKLRRSFLDLLAQMDEGTLAQYFTTRSEERRVGKERRNGHAVA